MAIEYFKFWCEWDIGCNDDIYSSKEVLLKHAQQALKDCEIEDEVQDLIKEGLFGIDHDIMVDE